MFKEAMARRVSLGDLPRTYFGGLEPIHSFLLPCWQAGGSVGRLASWLVGRLVGDPLACWSLGWSKPWHGHGKPHVLLNKEHSCIASQCLHIPLKACPG